MNRVVLSGRAAAEKLKELKELRAERTKIEGVGRLLTRLLPQETDPGPRTKKIEVPAHALREFRKKFPRYTRKADDGDLLEDLALFVEGGCRRSCKDGKDALVYHAPIWDRLLVVVRARPSDVEIVTVSRRSKELETDGSRRSGYGVLLASQLLSMSWREMVQKLYRIEHSGGRTGWGLIFRRRDDPRVLGAYFTAHELLDFWAYRNYLGETLLGRRLAHIAKRLELPAVVSTDGGIDELRAGINHHGLWADPPCPTTLELEMLNALLRRLEQPENKEEEDVVESH